MLRAFSINRVSLLKYRNSTITNSFLRVSAKHQYQGRFYSNGNNDNDHRKNAQIPFDIDSLIADLPDFPEDRNIDHLKVNDNDKINTSGTKESNGEDRTSETLSSFHKEPHMNFKPKDDIDTLLESLDLSSETIPENESPSGFSNLVNSQMEISSKEKSMDKNYKPVDVDKTDENVFGFDFWDLPNKKVDDSVVEEERQLFQNIFNSYIQPAKQKTKDKDLILNLRESVKLSQSKIDNLVEQNSNKYKLRSVSPTLKVDLFKKTEQALAPTIDYLKEMESSRELVEYMHKIFAKWTGLVEASRTDSSSFEDIFMNKLLRAKSKFGKRHSEFIAKIEESSKENPEEPILNVFTLPIVFNSVLNLLSFKFKNGQLAMSLFNILKKDINLYTVVCNQQTYNEVLRTHWIFNGKANLYGVEMIYLEMINNGFNGDLVTLNILKQIIIDYYNLKMGNSHLNKDTGLPIWTKEDDRRIDYLEKRLSRLANLQ